MNKGYSMSETKVYTIANSDNTLCLFNDDITNMPGTCFWEKKENAEAMCNIINKNNQNNKMHVIEYYTDISKLPIIITASGQAYISYW